MVDVELQIKMSIQHNFVEIGVQFIFIQILIAPLKNEGILLTFGTDLVFTSTKTLNIWKFAIKNATGKEVWPNPSHRLDLRYSREGSTF